LRQRDTVDRDTPYRCQLTEENKTGRSPFESAGRKMDQVLSEASERLETEGQQLIKYINDELVPAIRTQSSRGLKIAAEKLRTFAEHLDQETKGN
jgi:hypothetical protein